MKNTITKKIIYTYLAMIIFPMIIIGIVFAVSISKITERQLQKSLRVDLETIVNLSKRESNLLRKDATTENDFSEVRMNILLQGVLKRNSVQGVNFAIISKDFKVIQPKVKDDIEKIENVIIPELKKYLVKNKNQNATIKINIDGKDQMMVSSLFADLKYYIVLYAPIADIQEIGRGMFFVLAISMIITALIAVIIGIVIARSITKPIILLKNRAELVSKRDFDTKVNINSGDELEELAHSINKMAGELKEYDIAQKKFLQNASHELKTPLMSIQGYAEGIKDGVFESNDQALDIIVEESNRLKSIVEELIFLSKLETMDDFYTYNNESINEIIEKSTEKVMSIAAKSNININLMLYKDAQIRLDKDKFTQALINILGNCIRYARNVINVTTYNNGKNFEIVISDDGDGFEEKEIRNVFERFYKGKKGNTGLGLAITKAIIEKHGGLIAARNSINGGAEFKIVLEN